MATIAQHIYYRGNVQGVGFRYNALRCSKAYDVAGYVRNLPDGRVELLAEGEAREVRALTEEIRESMAGYIHDEELSEPEPTGNFTKFCIV